MVAMLNHTTANGEKIKDLVKSGQLSQDDLDSIVERTKKGGAEIVKYLEKGSVFKCSSRSWSADGRELSFRSKELPCAAYINGEYGVKNIYAMKVPVIIGKMGLKRLLR